MVPDEGDPTPPTAKTTKWRRRMKDERPEEYGVLQKEEALRSKLYRLQMSDEKKREPISWLLNGCAE